MKKYVVLEKEVGQTPLQCSEIYRKSQPELVDISMTYAGRLDPMASGKLLILLGDECKRQTEYRNLDKEYEFEVLFGVRSDTGDVLGRLVECDGVEVSYGNLHTVTRKLSGKIQLPYPHFSSKTVKGKPLHTWTLEGRINEIEIPTKQSVIYKIKCVGIYTKTRTEIHQYATTKIETISRVTDPSKALGNDFRRTDVRKDWNKLMHNNSPNDIFYIAKFICIASSGTYMRTLSEVIAKKINTCGLAYSIHRTKIGTYKKVPLLQGLWLNTYK